MKQSRGILPSWVDRPGYVIRHCAALVRHEGDVNQDSHPDDHCLSRDLTPRDQQRDIRYQYEAAQPPSDTNTGRRRRRRRRAAASTSKGMHLLHLMWHHHENENNQHKCEQWKALLPTENPQPDSYVSVRQCSTLLSTMTPPRSAILLPPLKQELWEEEVGGLAMPH